MQDAVSRAYRTPKILDRKISLTGYEGLVRQITITDLGHEEPTLLLTNQLKASPSKLVGRYARRMVIENGIQDSVDFFHMDALSSVVAMKVNCDVMLTVMAGSLYRLLGAQIGQGYEIAKSKHIFRDLVNATAQVVLGEKEISIHMQKRAHNPFLMAAGFTIPTYQSPGLLGNRSTLPWAETCMVLTKKLTWESRLASGAAIGWIRARDISIALETLLIPVRHPVVARGSGTGRKRQNERSQNQGPQEQVSYGHRRYPFAESREHLSGPDRALVLPSST